MPSTEYTGKKQDQGEQRVTTIIVVLKEDEKGLC